MITIFTDGGSRGNPGPAGYGVFIAKDEKTLVGFGDYIGEDTNNVAEYTAVLQAYVWLAAHKKEIADSPIAFFMDSQLVCNQLNGVYKVKHPAMQALFLQVKQKEKELAKSVSYTHVRREKNKVADSLVNQALDNRSRVFLQ